MPEAAARRYSSVAVLLHWTIVAAILFQIILGWRMGDGPKGPATYAIFQLHKSVGITILLLSVARLVWRLVNPPPLAHQPGWEKLAAKATHAGFYLIMIGLPLTGWIMVSASKTNIPTILYGAIPWPHLPGIPELAPAAKHVWREAGERGHSILLLLTYGLLALHLGAVAKHQVLDRDETLARMAPGARTGLFEPRLWLAALLVACAVTAGYLIKPTPPVAKPAPTPAVLAAPEPAVEPAPTAPAPPLPQPVKWTLAPGGALGFSTAWAGTKVEGRFGKWTADILFSPDALEKSKITVTVDVASVTTGDAQRDSTLPTEDWFASAAHPKAVFTAQKIRKLGEGRYAAEGTLDLKGVKHALTLPFTLSINGRNATARGALDIDRTIFKIGQGDFGGTDQIPALVKVKFALRATRAES
jgi:cytochrome b561/polyisoprenoid-binding protein YceI